MMGEMLQRSVPIDRPLDLRRTLRPLLGWFRQDGWWFTTSTALGPATLRLSRTRETVTGTAWGAGAEPVLESLPRIAGLEDDADFDPRHPLVSELHRRSPGLRFGATGDVFAHLVAAIVGQKVTRAEADRALQGLRREFGEPAPGPIPALRLPPDPEKIAEAPYWVFHTLHLEQRRARTLVAAARQAPRLRRLGTESVESAAEFLITIPGIGAWTIAKTLAPSHGDPDQLEVGDFHLKNLVAFHLTGRPRGTDEEMVELMEEFRPQRGRVVRLLHTLGHAPKYGPRMAPRDITRM